MHDGWRTQFLEPWVESLDHNHRGARGLSCLVEARPAAAFNRVRIVVVGMTSHLVDRAARAPKGAAAIITISAGGGRDVVLLANRLPRLTHGNQEVNRKDNVHDGQKSGHGIVSTRTSASVTRVAVVLAFWHCCYHNGVQDYPKYTVDDENDADYHEGLARSRRVASSPDPVATHSRHHLAENDFPRIERVSGLMSFKNPWTKVPVELSRGSKRTWA